MRAVGDLTRALGTFRPAPDVQQQQAVNAPASAGLLIVAGPATGKTASLTVRILKLVLVDGAPPRGILATTFTKMAAEELRSRVLGWGFRIIDALKNDPALSPKQKAFVDAVDINQVRTGREAPSVFNPARMKFGTVFRDISRQGRKFGIGLGVVSQQVSEIDNGVLTQLNTQLMMALGNADERREAVHAASTDIGGYTKELQVLARGQLLLSSSLRDIALPVQLANLDTLLGIYHGR